ncbi:FAD-dependent protein [Hydrotalea sp.]|uniref:NAD(P)/FAD-dependent oxidoreductase n=1 Tax=Hydrotalea sp. TaxID=2881279 RepID=UPI002588B005|nr:NAD(P)/FAD-dependent oxidoreductase [Hydrotalea sp.]
MQKSISLRLTPAQAADALFVENYLAKELGIAPERLSGFFVEKESIDARSRQQVWMNKTIRVYVDEPFIERPRHIIQFPSVHHATTKVIIIGAGPAGLFAALSLIEKGIQPIILERGKAVRERRRDLARLNKEGIVNTDSNYCFGEGGAGTYSDGKLYTRSTKRGDVNRILQLFVQFGADEKILYQAHPHIGTNKLPHIITAMRQQIIDAGGACYFEQRVVDFLIEHNQIKGVLTANNAVWKADAVILATGHSARDIFHLFFQKKIGIEAKPFALGVRVEHPQALIDAIQYHCPISNGHVAESNRDLHLPPAAYSLVEQVNGRGVFSFCMCPGGIIAPAATSPNELVVNGWSPSKRNNPFANSGMVVQVGLKDAAHWLLQHENWYREQQVALSIPSKVIPPEQHPLALLYFQQWAEQLAFTAGGGHFVAPAQRLIDFTNNKMSSSLPDCSYIPGLQSVDLKGVLPDFIHQSLQQGFKNFGKKMKGYLTNEAVVVATESRTSSPVRIPRNSHTLQHPQIQYLYPCGEGAGYAGGIVSAAIDGELVAAAIAQRYV